MKVQVSKGAHFLTIHSLVGVAIIWKVKGWTSTNRYIHNTPPRMSIKDMPY